MLFPDYWIREAGGSVRGRVWLELLLWRSLVSPVSVFFGPLLVGFAVNLPSGMGEQGGW